MAARAEIPGPRSQDSVTKSNSDTWSIELTGERSDRPHFC